MRYGNWSVPLLRPALIGIPGVLVGSHRRDSHPSLKCPTRPRLREPQTSIVSLNGPLTTAAQRGYGPGRSWENGPTDPLGAIPD